MKPASVGIVGGMGRMGSLLARLLAGAGYRVECADTRQDGTAAERVAENDVVILAVPISALETVVKQIGPFTRKDGAVIEIASVKQAPVRFMREHCRGEVICSHPLFGPSLTSLKDQVVFLCPLDPGPWTDWFRRFFSERGARVVDMEPERHDRLMATVQVLRHLVLFCFGRALLELDFNLEEDLNVSGPWFSCLVEMLRRQLDQSPDLYADLALHNPAVKEVARCFLEAANESGTLFGSRDSEGIRNFITEIRPFFTSPRDGRQS